ncbi:unnamed protein product, partial [Amoebophrya sp. A25]
HNQQHGGNNSSGVMPPPFACGPHHSYPSAGYLHHMNSSSAGYQNHLQQHYNQASWYHQAFPPFGHHGGAAMFPSFLQHGPSSS